jgi:hypothetical protein
MAEAILDHVQNRGDRQNRMEHKMIYRQDSRDRKAKSEQGDWNRKGMRIRVKIDRTDWTGGIDRTAQTGQHRQAGLDRQNYRRPERQA